MDLRKILKNEYETVIMVNQKLKKLEYIKREILDIIGSLKLYSGRFSIFVSSYTHKVNW